MTPPKPIPDWAWPLTRWWWGLGPDYKHRGRLDAGYGQRTRPKAPKPAPQWFVTWVQRFKPKPPSPPAPVHQWLGVGLYSVKTTEGGMPAGDLVAMLQVDRFDYVLVQYDPADTERINAIRAGCQAAGKSFRWWDDAPTIERATGMHALAPDAPVVFQAEMTDAAAVKDLEVTLRYARSSLWPDPIPLALVSNLGPSRTDPTFDPLMHQLGIADTVEAYTPENPQATVTSMVWDATRRGYTDVVPVIEARDDHQLSEYVPFPPSFAVWAETTLQEPGRALIRNR